MKADLGVRQIALLPLSPIEGIFKFFSFSAPSMVRGKTGKEKNLNCLQFVILPQILRAEYLKGYLHTALRPARYYPTHRLAAQSLQVFTLQVTPPKTPSKAFCSLKIRLPSKRIRDTYRL